MHSCIECAFLQSARDIESKMRNETRLKLFTLDADTQVKTLDKQTRQSDNQTDVSLQRLENAWNVYAGAFKISESCLNTEVGLLWD